MTHRDDRGMATAEYTIGTVGAVLIATILYQLALRGPDSFWLEHLFDLIQDALSWRNIFKGMPRLGLRI